ncbi:MAG TPA: hypothetical protein VK308_01410 [Pyrinomonadaceae bacterium]|nr:hypothetical protein [Pyrinomonadaceae bacterium]
MKTQLSKKTTVWVLTYLFMTPFLQAVAQSKPKIASSTEGVLNIESERCSPENITAGKLKDYLEFVASDEIKGRGTSSRGLNLTAKFLALNMSQAGVNPGGDNKSYFQPIDLRRTKVNAAETRRARRPEFRFRARFFNTKAI